MRETASVDAMWSAFLETLPAPLQDTGRELAPLLGLSPSREVPWSEVFGYEVTLGAPAMVAEAIPGLSDSALRSAALAHLLAVIEAFGTDRIEDGQVPATPGLVAVLAHARRARDGALAQIVVGTGAAGLSYAEADRETLAAIELERATFRDGAASFRRYLAVARTKQGLGLPASVALARAAGWGPRSVWSLARLLEAVGVGLQLHDDVLDWEDDLARGGAWACALASNTAPLRGGVPARGSNLNAVRRMVHETGVLARMLATSARSFGGARRRATQLGLGRLAEWSLARETTVRALAEREVGAPGSTNRAHQLCSWASVVLG